LVGTPNARSEASTICFLTGAGVSLGSERKSSCALVTRSRSSASTPAASYTAARSSAPVPASPRGSGPLSSIGVGCGVGASAYLRISASTSSGLVAAPSAARAASASSCTTNQPSTVLPQVFFSFTEARLYQNFRIAARNARLPGRLGAARLGPLGKPCHVGAGQLDDRAGAVPFGAVAPAGLAGPVQDRGPQVADLAA